MAASRHCEEKTTKHSRVPPAFEMAGMLRFTLNDGFFMGVCSCLPSASFFASTPEESDAMMRENAFLQDAVAPAKRLDRCSTAARRPNGLPGLRPFPAYAKEASADASNDLQKIFSGCRNSLAPFLNPAGQQQPT